MLRVGARRAAVRGPGPDPGPASPGPARRGPDGSSAPGRTGGGWPAAPATGSRARRSRPRPTSRSTAGAGSASTPRRPAAPSPRPTAPCPFGPHRRGGTCRSFAGTVPGNHEIPPRRIFSTGSRQLFPTWVGNSCWVELRGFEPLAPSMRTRCATGLRHSPNEKKLYQVRGGGRARIPRRSGACYSFTARGWSPSSAYWSKSWVDGGRGAACGGGTTARPALQVSGPPRSRPLVRRGATGAVT